MIFLSNIKNLLNFMKETMLYFQSGPVVQSGVRMLLKLLLPTLLLNVLFCWSLDFKHTTFRPLLAGLCETDVDAVFDTP